jgi:hypothetical protein
MPSPRCHGIALYGDNPELKRSFENRVLRRIFGPTRHKAIGGWRKLPNEELNNLYSSPNIIRIVQ